MANFSVITMYTGVLEYFRYFWFFFLCLDPYKISNKIASTINKT